MRFPFQLTAVRQVRGRKDPTKSFTIIEGLLTLPDAGGQIFMEGLMEAAPVPPGNYAIELKIGVDRARKLTVFVQGLQPLQQGRAAA